MAKISVLNTDITVLNYNSHDYISLTDMASAKEGDSRAADIIKNWIRNRYTIEFLGTWEMIHNPIIPPAPCEHPQEAGGFLFLPQVRSLRSPDVTILERFHHPCQVLTTYDYLSTKRQ